MTSRVVVEREIFLNGERYALGGDGKVRTIVTSQYPPKLVLGDVDKDSNPRTSVIVWGDWSGGFGLYSTNGREGMNRSSFSRADGRYKGHLTLPPLVTNSSAHSVGGYITSINELGVKLYGALYSGLRIYSWVVGSDTWSSELDALPAQAVGSLRFTLAGTEYLAFAHTVGYTYTSNGAAYTDIATATVSLAFWDSRLWGISNTGQLWFASAIGTPVLDANIGLPAVYAKNLFVGPDASGEEILYCATREGLYAHDAANARFVRTKVQWPNKAVTDDVGIPVQAAATWNGDIYVSPGGMAVYRYSPTQGLVASIGLDRDAGIPDSGLRGDIISLIPTHVGLLAVVHAADAHLIWDYNGVGWHYLTRSSSAIVDANHVSDIGGSYRLYCEGNGLISYAKLQTGGVNPEIDTNSYDGTNDIATHITPWFNAGQNEIDKTAIRVRIECAGMSSDETAKVEYALNYAATYESSTFTVTANGVTTKTFPTVANNNPEAGSDFQAIRFKLTLNRGSTATLTPNVKSLSLEWRRKIPARYGFEFTLDRSQGYGGRTPKEMKADIITAIETSAQVEFTFVDDDGSTQNYYVDVTNMEDVEDTGHGEIGQTRLAVVEA